MPQPEKYPLKSLQVGQPVLVNDGKHLCNYLLRRAKELGIVIRTRRDGDKRKVVRVA